MFQGMWLHFHHGHSTVAVRQTCPSQCLLGCGTRGMQFIGSSMLNFSFIFLLSGCKMSEYVPDFLPGGNGMGKGIAAHIYCFASCHSQLPESILHLSHLISLILLAISF